MRSSLKIYTLAVASICLSLMSCSENKGMQNERRIFGDGSDIVPVTIESKNSSNSTITTTSRYSYSLEVVDSIFETKGADQPEKKLFSGQIVGFFQDSGLILEGDRYSIFNTVDKTESVPIAKPEYTYLVKDQIFKVYPYKESLEEDLGAWGLVDMNSSEPSLANPQIVKLMKSDTYATMVSPVAMKLESVSDLRPLLVNAKSFWFQLPGQIVMMNVSDSTVRKTVISIEHPATFKVLGVSHNSRLLVKDDLKYILYVFDVAKSAVKSYTITEKPLMETLIAVHPVEEGVLFVAKPRSYLYALADNLWRSFSVEVSTGVESLQKEGLYYYYPANRTLNNYEGSHTKIKIPEILLTKKEDEELIVAANPDVEAVLKTSCRGCHASESDSGSFTSSTDFNPINLNHIKYLVQTKGKAGALSVFENMCTLSRNSLCRSHTAGEKLLTDLVNSL